MYCSCAPLSSALCASCLCCCCCCCYCCCCCCCRHYFASGGGDNVARLWCTSRSFPLRLLQHPGGAADVPQVYIHPNSSLLLTGASDGVVRLFALRAADLVRSWTPPRAAATTAAAAAAAAAAAGAGAVGGKDGAAVGAAAAARSSLDTPLRWPLDPRLLSGAGRVALGSSSSSMSSSSGCCSSREVTALTASSNGRLVAAAGQRWGFRV